MSISSALSRPQRNPPSRPTALDVRHGPDLTLLLPVEIMQQILEHLDARSLDYCALVNRMWHEQCMHILHMRGARHVRLTFQIVGGDTEDGEIDVYWLFKNDTYEEMKSILVSLCSRFRLWRLSSLDRSFANSFQDEINALMTGHDQARMVMQLRISGYLDSLNHSERELNSLVFKSPNVLNAMTEGVLIKVRADALQKDNPASSLACDQLVESLDLQP